MVHTVALLGANGRVGRCVLPHLVKAHHSGTIKLVILHRSDAPPTLAKDSGVETRVVDLQEPDAQKLGEAVKGVNTLLATLGIMVIATIGPLVEAFSKSADAIAYIPPMFSKKFSQSQIESESLKGMMTGVSMLVQATKALGVEVTTVHTGVFDEDFFALQYLQADVNGNTIVASQVQLVNPVAITSIEYLGAGLSQIALLPPKEIRGATYSLVDLMPTGNDLVRAFTTINGAETIVVDETPEKKQQVAEASMFGVVQLAYREDWAEGWDYPNRIEVKGWKAVNTLDVARSYKKEA